jgi:hypothetical protein
MGLLSTATAQLLQSVEQLGASLRDHLARQLLLLRGAVRAEVRRAASAIALALVAAAMAIAAVGFAAAAVLIAAWDTHPVLAAAAIATGFLLLAVTAFLAMLRCTR